MAKYELEDYQLKKMTESTEPLVEALFLELQMKGTTGKRSSINKAYRISGDRRFSLDYLLNILPNELDKAKEGLQYVELNEYLERNYVFFSFKSGNHMQVTASKVK